MSENDTHTHTHRCWWDVDRARWSCPAATAATAATTAPVRSPR